MAATGATSTAARFDLAAAGLLVVVSECDEERAGAGAMRCLTVFGFLGNEEVAEGPQREAVDETEALTSRRPI
jgi:hypothetical protein